jgi:hypothetical protein
LLALCTLLLLGLSIGLACWVSQPRSASADFDLLADDASPKLKDTSAETPTGPVAQAPQSEPEKPLFDAASVKAPVPREGDPLAFPPPSLGPSAPPPIPTGEPQPGASAEGLADGYRNPHRGDTPMMSTWKTLGWPAFLSVLLTAGPAAAQVKNSDGTTKPPDLTTLASQLDAIKKKVDSIDIQVQTLASVPKSLGTLKEATDKLTDAHNDLKQALERVEKRVDDELRALQSRATATDLKLLKAQTDITSLLNQLDGLRKDMDGLGSRVAGTQISAYPPREPPPTATGRLRLVNTYFQPMTIVVNRAAYTVAPGESRMTEPIPAGVFSYEVLGVQPGPQSRVLAANETFTVTVHPQ